PLYGEAPQEQDPPTALSPSQVVADMPAASSPVRGATYVQKGVAIHRILQYLPAITDKDKWVAVANTLTESHAPALSEKEKHEAVTQAIGVLDSPQYAALFGAD